METGFISLEISVEQFHDENIKFARSASSFGLSNNRVLLENDGPPRNGEL